MSRPSACVEKLGLDYPLMLPSKKAMKSKLITIITFLNSMT